VPPPGLLSTTTVWPSFSDKGPEITRAAASDAPPGGKVTTTFTGRVGHCWAAGLPTAASATTNAKTSLRAIMEIPRIGLVTQSPCRVSGAATKK
jgi:hypothetical protein